MEHVSSNNDRSEAFLFMPGTAGAGVLVRRDQIIGARPNGPGAGAIVYTAAGPSIYTALSTHQLANLTNAQVIEPAR